MEVVILLLQHGNFFLRGHLLPLLGAESVQIGFGGVLFLKGGVNFLLEPIIFRLQPCEFFRAGSCFLRVQIGEGGVGFC